MPLTRLLSLFVMTLSITLFTGCEGDDETPPTEDVVAEETPEDDSGSETDPHFPDGLHPDSGGDSIIAGVFAAYLSGNPGQTVVCLGDSITSGGYPGPLAGLTGMNVIDAGSPGEKSDGGLFRINGVLQQYQPDYICILYGANDIIGAHWGPGVTVGNLSAMVQAAKDAGCTPIVGTLTPMSGDKYGEYADEARATSAAIRGMGGAAIADLENAF